MGPGHTGIVGTELADYKATQGVHIGMAKGEKNIATPVGIRQHFRKRRQLKEWDRDAMSGYTYIYTDKGPFMYWLHQIGRKDDNKCSCNQGAVQNASHILKCKKVADGKGRTREQVEGDPHICREVFKFLQDQV